MYSVRYVLGGFGMAPVGGNTYDVPRHHCYPVVKYDPHMPGGNTCISGQMTAGQTVAWSALPVYKGAVCLPSDEFVPGRPRSTTHPP